MVTTRLALAGALVFSAALGAGSVLIAQAIAVHVSVPVTVAQACPQVAGPPEVPPNHPAFAPLDTSGYVPAGRSLSLSSERKGP